MGVRGLTSYIAQRAEIYLKPFELHSTALVIDGDNLSCNLYKDVAGSYSAFGGDYDDFYRAVVQFFQVLAECNIRPYVLMDGGYEERKLRTVSTRLRGKITVIKKINPNASITLFPLHLKEVFVDAVRDCGVPVMRCVFEADDELAALARKLNCPVLSYDSDFYIHNVKYIPLITLTVKVLTKQVKAKNNHKQKDSRDLRRNEAKNVEKRTKANKIVAGIQASEEVTSPKGNTKTYKYLDCCIYRVSHLCGRSTLSPEKLPLFAALLGNDYIARSAFKNFFAAGMGKAGRSRKLKIQQKRIQVILTWLKEETAESALAKVLSRLKKNQRESLVSQVHAAISGYSNELCHAYDFFEEHYEKAFPYVEPPSSEEELSDEEDVEENLSGDDDLAGEDEQLDEAENQEEDEEEGNENQEPDSGAEVEEEAEEESDEVEVEDKTLLFPQWFLDKLYPAHLSRYFVDLMHLRKYINNPQIEHFPYHDSNELALPILNYVFALLHNVEGSKTEPQLDEEGAPLPIAFTYLTRALRVTNVRYFKMPIEKQPAYAFEPTAPDARHLKAVFEENVPHANTEKLFKKLDELPEDLRLYFLAIVYWLHRSEHCDLLHLHSLILSLIVLRTIDVTIPAEREVKAFRKRFGKILKAERGVRDKELGEGIKRGIKPALLQLSVPDRMAHVPKSDCYLTQERLLPHFHMQEIFKKKFDLYSTTVIHSFAEFQAVVYQLNGLNALLDLPLQSPRMNQLYCGAFLYNIYDLLRNRGDVRYHIENFLLPDSKMMFDFYCFLYDWCAEFVPHWKEVEVDQTAVKAQKKRLKKQRQAARKTEAKESNADPNADMLVKDADPDDDFFDLNNKFCALKVG
ncbi:LOW QUALITY PROTEIN: protein asteroid [Drosophila gunungcola]|uniref:LOW QUALITY PROTEIN: protein asteroid n=1 Tax=Drosophila gunungcola TaxID=103775 RepID=UPI0022E15DE1|nr:LOW QUALITY PROTEIN: protein asteroid [Drosophila gunungcola]